MKLVRFTCDEKTAIGKVFGDQIVDLSRFAEGAASMRRFLRNMPSRKAQIDAATAPAYPLSSVHLEAPINDPQKFPAIGMNYQAHAEEAARAGIPIPKTQLWFNKQVSCIAGPTDKVVLSTVSDQFDYEGRAAGVSSRLEVFGRGRFPDKLREPDRAGRTAQSKLRPTRTAHRQASEDHSNPGLSRKLGSEIALRLEEEFLSAGWSVGQVFGLQADIQRRYNIGRPALREAIHILEMRGSAVMRRGRGGGLTIAHPAMENIMKPCALHLLVHHATREQFNQAKRLLNVVAGQLIARRRLEAQYLTVELAATLSRDRAMLTAFAKATDNPAFQFIESILRLVGGCRFMGGDRKNPSCLAPIVSVIVEERFEMLPDVASRLSSYRPEQPQNALDLFGWLKPRSSLNHCRYSAQLAFKILEQIMAQPSEQPVFLGSEWEMAEQYGYSPEVVRQASRILEDMGVIESRLGRNGGLFTRKPGEAEVSSQIFAYCMKQSVSPSNAVEVLVAIEQQMASEGIGKIATNPILTLFASMLKAYARWAKSSNMVRSDAAVHPIPATRLRKGRVAPALAHNG